MRRFSLFKVILYTRAGFSVAYGFPKPRSAYSVTYVDQIVRLQNQCRRAEQRTWSGHSVFATEGLCITPDKAIFFFFFCQPKSSLVFFLFLHERMLWYSLEAPRGGVSNEYPQHVFSWRNIKKNIFHGLLNVKY